MTDSYAEGPIDSKSTGPSIVADHMAAVMQRMFKQAGMVAKEASGHVDDDNFGYEQWLKTMTKLFDIAMVGGVDLVQTAVIGPAPYTTAAFNSKKFSVAAAKRSRTLSIEPPGLARPGSNDAIPQGKIKVVPEQLAAGQTEFYFQVNEAGLPSGIYTGQVRVGDEKELVDVAIRL